MIDLPPPDTSIYQAEAIPKLFLKDKIAVVETVEKTGIGKINSDKLLSKTNLAELLKEEYKDMSPDLAHILVEEIYNEKVLIPDLVGKYVEEKGINLSEGYKNGLIIFKEQAQAIGFLNTYSWILKNETLKDTKYEPLIDRLDKDLDLFNDISKKLHLSHEILIDFYEGKFDWIIFVPNSNKNSGKDQNMVFFQVNGYDIGHKLVDSDKGKIYIEDLEHLANEGNFFKEVYEGGIEAIKKANYETPWEDGR